MCSRQSTSKLLKQHGVGVEITPRRQQNDEGTAQRPPSRLRSRETLLATATRCSASYPRGFRYMRADIVPGAIFPDYELSDHTTKRRKLSELQGSDPMVLVLSRGAFVPKDRRQAEGLLTLHREMEVGYCRLVTISTANITETNEYRSGVGAHWPFLSDPGRVVQKDLDALHASSSPGAFTLCRWVVPNIGRQLILERCIHGVAEQFHSRIRPEGNDALHKQPLVIVHDDLQALELVAIHGPHPAKEGGALIELKLGCIGTGTTRSARLSENRRADFTPLDRPHQDRAVEYDVFGKQLTHLGGCRFTGFPQFS